MRQILIVEDDKTLADLLVETIEEAGFTCQHANNGKQAFQLATQMHPDLILSDVRMDGVSGIEFLQSIHEKMPATPVILMTAYSEVDDAVRAMQLGAVDYLQKPFSGEFLLDKINRFLKPTFDGKGFDPIAECQSSRGLMQLAAKVAASDVSVLIEGESGSGKEVVAQFIHLQSSRSDKPFIAVNCAAIPDNMLEAMLFGYEKGAFTGAYKSAPGKFEQANGGTLLLDEVSEMPLALQAKLLRVLQEKEVERLGGQAMIPLDVRVIATTNRKLQMAVQEGSFREDLYFRLNVFPLTCLPLRERQADIIPLANYLISKYCHQNRPVVPSLSKEAEALLMQHSWPGNVRELDNVIQRSLVLCEQDVIQACHLHNLSQTGDLSLKNKLS
ncbi:sigma-54-dependent transcriptional regulator [Legionella sp. W05-934-2]|jgi:two-component system response regulator FlrC|uniref:sigma-54-dependent transcriptional regulator n=1 Tax=Legionella sp. W05-934-2 TaxID=1198649 RepID=UPI0034617B8A